MSDEPAMREQACEAIQHGRLPANQPTRMLFGPSAGETCAVCGVLVPRGEMAIQLEFQRGLPPAEKALRDPHERLGAKPEVRGYHLHSRCFAAWELERTRSAEGRTSG